jgi:hypothetical protein
MEASRKKKRKNHSGGKVHTQQQGRKVQQVEVLK